MRKRMTLGRSALALAAGLLMTAGYAGAGVVIQDQARSVGGTAELAIGPNGDTNAFTDEQISADAGYFSRAFVAEAAVSLPPRSVQAAANGSLDSTLSSTNFAFGGSLSTVAITALNAPAADNGARYDLKVAAGAAAQVLFKLDEATILTPSTQFAGNLSQDNKPKPGQIADNTPVMTRELLFAIFQNGQQVLNLLSGGAQTLAAGNYELRFADNFSTVVKNGVLVGPAGSHTFANDGEEFAVSVSFAAAPGTPPVNPVPLPPAAAAGLLTMAGGWVAGKVRKLVK